MKTQKWTLAELVAKRSDFQVAYKNGYLTRREYDEAMAELKKLWEAYHSGK